MDDQSRYEYARKQVRALKGFYGHFAVYLVINLFLAVVNLAASPSVLWFVWPLLGWGIAVAMHAVAVFIVGGVWSAGWEERKVQEIAGQLRSQP
ncbi:MAG: 2TM domain-containing protein [Planctomycetia bacterium]|nr:2TM domain-containing protein [Planctomycetia bacterium]